MLEDGQLPVYPGLGAGPAGGGLGGLAPVAEGFQVQVGDLGELALPEFLPQDSQDLALPGIERLLVLEVDDVMVGQLVEGGGGLFFGLKDVGVTAFFFEALNLGIKGLGLLSLLEGPALTLAIRVIIVYDLNHAFLTDFLANRHGPLLLIMDSGGIAPVW